MLPAFWYAGKPIGFDIAPVLSVVWKFFVASVAAGCSTALLIHFVPVFAKTPGAQGALARLISGSLLFWTLYLGAVVALYRGPEPLRQAGRLFRDLLPQRTTMHSNSQPALAVTSSALLG
jgi:hypothetical protein